MGYRIEEKTAYIGIGSNLGGKINNCLQSIKDIDKLPGCHVIARSSTFKTEPDGVKGQDWYANCVIQIKTTQSPSELLRSLLEIESGMGRIRKKKWEARIIDLDILLFNQEIISSDSLSIPHPLLHKRRFVLEPLAQLAPDLIHPVLKLTVRQLKEELPRGPYVEML